VKRQRKYFASSQLAHIFQLSDDAFDPFHRGSCCDFGIRYGDAFEAELGYILGCCFVLAVVRHVHDPYEHSRRL
jgi:hypothetical protein